MTGLRQGLAESILSKGFDVILREKEFQAADRGFNPLDDIERATRSALALGETPVRMAVTKTDKGVFHCELGVLASSKVFGNSIFTFREREGENCDSFNVVMVVPTGIGAEIGGHAGDACPAAKLLGSACDTLITHPNVVNASDINEMPPNCLYVEGSVISDLLMGTCGLIPVRSNRVLVLMNKHKESQISSATINAVSAARASMGISCPAVVEIDPPLVMRATYSSAGRRVGKVEGLISVSESLHSDQGQYDAVAIASVIDVPDEYHTEYFHQAGEMVNPWGGVEAMLTHAITRLYNVPAAHSPMYESNDIANLDVGVVDPRMAAEVVSVAFLHCVLKGLHKSPQITRCYDHFRRHDVIAAENISCLVIPDGCVGLPTLAAMQQGIPVIAVRQNKNQMQNNLAELPFRPGGLITVDNYLEAAGVIAAMKAGVSLESIQRPLPQTKLVLANSEHA